jgi:phosphate:Na+ symporter
VIVLNLLAALALLLWGSRQMDRGMRDLGNGWWSELARAARRGRHVAASCGFAAGLLRPAESGWRAASLTGLPPARAVAMLLGVNAGAAAATLLLLHAPAWSFHALTIAGAAATLSARHARLQHAGRVLFGTGLVLLAVRLLEAAASAQAPAPLGAAVAQGLAQDVWLALTTGALLVFCLRGAFPAVLVVALTWSAWLQPEAAVAVLFGTSLGAALLAYAASRPDAVRHQVTATQLLVAMGVAALGLLLRADLALLLAGGTPASLVLLNAAVHALAAVVFLNLAGPLTRGVQRRLPRAPAPPAVPAPHGVGLDACDLQDPSLALTAALRELMRMADIVDRMLRMAKDVFLVADVAAAQSIRAAEQQVNASYRALKQFLAQVARRPLGPDEQVRWEEQLAFLISMEQVADRVCRLLDDLEARQAAARLAYPADEEGDVIALHGQLTQNLRSAAGVCLERSVPAARELAAGRRTFRQLEAALRAAHVGRLVGGATDAAAVSALHLNMLADFVDMNDQVCAFAERFVEMRAEPAEAAMVAPSVS